MPFFNQLAALRYHAGFASNLGKFRQFSWHFIACRPDFRGNLRLEKPDKPMQNKAFTSQGVGFEYLAQAPWFQVIQEDRATAATTVYTALRAIDSLKVLLAPFVPFSAERIHQALGYEQPLFGIQRIATYAEGERTHEALVYDATCATGRWAPSTLPSGQRLAWSQPPYRKIDTAATERPAS